MGRYWLLYRLTFARAPSLLLRGSFASPEGAVAAIAAHPENGAGRAWFVYDSTAAEMVEVLDHEGKDAEGKADYLGAEGRRAHWVLCI